jgi:bacterial/archaeal transporter family-2 protein
LSGPWTLVFLGALGIFAGANLAFQAVVNAQLRTFLGTPLRAALVSYVVGTLCCVIALIATRQSLVVLDPSMRTHWWLWTGGLYGLIYLVLAIWLIPRLGSAPVFGLVVAGQMLAALLFDQIGLFGIPARAIDPSKLIGAGFLVAGVVLLRR